MTMKMVILMREKSGRLGWREDYTRAAGPITCKTLAGSHRYGNNNGCIPIFPNQGDIPYVTCYEYITWCHHATATETTGTYLFCCSINIFHIKVNSDRLCWPFLQHLFHHVFLLRIVLNITGISFTRVKW